jgi:phage terminase small subunit
MSKRGLIKQKVRTTVQDNRRAAFVIEYVKDFASRRAAEASGYSPEQGYKLLQEPDIQEAIKIILEDRMEEAGIDATWLLYELVDNHRIARQQGNISSSNTALKILAQLAIIDALAKQRVELDVISDKELLDRLQRGRKRMNNEDGNVSFL